MGSILVSSGAKGKRFILPNGEIMIHQVSGSSAGQFSDMEIAVKHAGRIQERPYSILADNTGKSIDQIRKDADRDNWFNAEESVAYGLVDKIITKK
jgi:ATP-dependent Clp protease protease subunit